MPSTRTPGIRVSRNGELIIDKEYRGTPIYVRQGATTQERAEERLAEEMHRVEAMFARRQLEAFGITRSAYRVPAG